MPDSTPDSQQKEIKADMSWDPQSDITIKGYEWQEISNFLQFFQGAMLAYNAVVSRNIASGVINLKYTYEDGSEIPVEELENRQRERLNEYMEQVKKAQPSKVPAAGK